MTKSATMNIFRKKKYFLFKSIVKAELINFTINLFTIAVNCMDKTKQLIKIAKRKHFSDSVTDSKDTRAIKIYEIGKMYT